MAVDAPKSLPWFPSAVQTAKASGLRLERDAEATEHTLGSLVLDSRKPFPQEGRNSTPVYVALRGTRHDGHAYMAEAYRRGARCFVAERRMALPGPATWLLADARTAAEGGPATALEALQRLAALRRQAYQGPLLAITGSGGKTIVKEWLATLLGPDWNAYRSPRSFNSQVGVPLSAWGLRPEHELGMLEAGISQPGEMPRLAAILRPTHGLFTGLGDAHDAGFPSRAAKLEEKLRLFEGAEMLFYRADRPAGEDQHSGQPDAPHAAEILHRRFPDARHRTWSLDPAVPATLQAELDGDRLRVQSPEGPWACTLPFSDPFCAVNLMHAASAALAFGLHPHRLMRRIPLLALPDMRLQVLPGIGDSVVVNDAYASDLGSLRVALEFAGRQAAPGMRRTAILSSIEQSGRPAKALYREVAALLNANGYTRLIAVGDAFGEALCQPAVQEALAGLDTRVFPDADALIEALPDLDFGREAILVKGARRFRLERVVERLGMQHHGTRLEIDLDALAHNVEQFKTRVGPDTRLAVMVKALGYGAGDVEVARCLEERGVDYLGVAYPDEGIALRQGGIRLPTMVLNAAPESWRVCRRFELEPVCPRWAYLRLLRRDYPDLPLHLELESGMHRLGLTGEGVDALCADPELLRGLRLASIFSHLAAADDPAEDAFTRTQIARFREASGRILAAWRAVNPEAPAPLRHLANSAGAMRFSDAADGARFDLVRLGIGVYGYGGPAAAAAGLDLRPVARLRTTVSQIEDVPAGESVGYGRAARMDRDTRVATLAIGYADGYRRALAGKGFVYAHGKRLPLLGRVCMDMIMVDASDCPRLQAGDPVELFGEHIRVEEVAAWMDSIPYEVLAGIAYRVKRVYWSA